MPSSAANDDTLAPASAQPVGTGAYEVGQGECIHSIAFDHGLFWETLWNHPDNSEVKSARESPSLLMVGDKLTVPPLTIKKESRPNEARHKFKRKGVPAKLVLILMRQPEDDRNADGTDPNADPNGASKDPDPVDPKAQEPWADAAWTCTIDGELSTGTTGSDGKIELTISPGARQGKLVIDSDKPTQRVIMLNLGGLEPPDSVKGVMQRLRNLGFAPGSGDPPGEGDAAGVAQLREAIERFQVANELDKTGKLNDATIDKLKEVHGS
ncbi:MAG: peptidoglycan-binding domain-containing protein [Phycisphaerales bacterium]|jgi:N-acetylmuramoyl-L-alanine amidase